MPLLQVPVKPTIKEVDSGLNVVKTLQRSKLWEVQTPQVIRPTLLRQGFDLVKSKGLEVTDDVRYEADARKGRHKNSQAGFDSKKFIRSYLSV